MYAKSMYTSKCLGYATTFNITALYKTLQNNH